MRTKERQRITIDGPDSAYKKKYTVYVSRIEKDVVYCTSGK